jgi:phosphoglycerate dehydrogenase-like enzyme
MSRRLFLAAGDSEDGQDARAATDLLPADWVVADEPDDVTAILAVDVDVDGDVVKRAGPGLQVVATIGPAVDEAAAAAAGARVVELLTDSQLSRLTVAEYNVTLMLTLVHNMVAVSRTASEPWASGRDTPILTDQETYVYNWTDVQGSGFLRGRTVGIVGAGTIGKATARLLLPFGARVLYTQRTRLPAADEQGLGVEWREFDDLLRESDILSLCHRLQEGPGGNEGQFGAREFAMMKPTAILINTARGRVIDEDVLVAALRDGQIAGAGLDVFHYEPLPKDHPLLQLAGDNVIISPHVASGTENEFWRYTFRRVIDACSATPAI